MDSPISGANTLSLIQRLDTTQNDVVTCSVCSGDGLNLVRRRCRSVTRVICLIT